MFFLHITPRQPRINPGIPTGELFVPRPSDPVLTNTTERQYRNSPVMGFQPRGQVDPHTRISESVIKPHGWIFPQTDLSFKAWQIINHNNHLISCASERPWKEHPHSGNTSTRGRPESTAVVIIRHLSVRSLSSASRRISRKLINRSRTSQ